MSWALDTNDGFSVIYKQPFRKSRGIENCKWRFQENCIQFKIT